MRVQCSDNWRLGERARELALSRRPQTMGKRFRVCTGSVSMFWEERLCSPTRARAAAAAGAQGWYWRHRPTTMRLVSVLTQFNAKPLTYHCPGECLHVRCVRRTLSIFNVRVPSERERELTMRWPSTEPFRLCPSNAKRRRAVCDLYVRGFALHYIGAGRTQSLFA
jgi:hypothetical protein